MGYKISKGFMWVRGPNIPAEYQEVEYIQSSGTQYIDTGYIITPNTEISADFQFTSTTSQQMVFGIGQDNNTSSGINFNVYIAGGIVWSAGLSDGTSSNSWNNTSVSANTNRNKFVLNNGTFKTYDSSGTLINTTNTKTTITRNAEHSFGIFARRETYYSAFRNFSSGKLYGLQIKENGTLAQDLVPCYRKSDGVIGVYDEVNNVFYTNSGSGTFTKGNDVAPTYVFKEKQFYPGVPPTPPGPSYTTILDVDFTNTTDSALTSLGFRSIGVSYGLRSETGTGLRWVNYQTDVAAGVEFDYADSLVGKILAWECEVYCGRFDIWGNVNLNISNPRNYSNMSDRYSNLANFGMTGLPGFNSNQYTGVNGGGYWDPTNGSIEGDKSGGLYWDSYGTYHLGLPFTTGIYKMTGSYNFSTWQFTNTWETPNGTLATWTRDFSACTAAQKTIMNNFLATTNKQFILQESRGYGNGTGYDVNYRRKLKIKVA